MKKLKKILALILSMSLIAAPVLPVRADNESSAAREVEYLPRGGYGIAVDGGIYLSWRLLGTEPINQTFDIYRNDEVDPFVSDLDATNYTDEDGKVGDVYKVTPHNGTAMENDVFIASAKDYRDIILDKPDATEEYSYVVRDVSVGDVDNDGEYEFFIKWDPSNYKDNSENGYTGNVYIDCYKQNGKKLWRIDLGQNIRAGAHYTQFIVYDFDGNGKAEMALRTAPGSKDGNGNYVSAKGAPIVVDGEEEPFTFKDLYTNEEFSDTDDLRDNVGRIKKGPDWLTMFNGETGEAMQTVNYYPQRGNVSDWGDDAGNRSERYNAGVAYLDGVHPSLFIARGYYKRAAMAAYDWKNGKFTMRWHRDDKGKRVVAESSNNTHQNMDGTLYGNGDHQISVCDADNDGKDEIVFGSTVVDDNGSILNSTDHGHGDALHASDFDNDGKQEIFQVHEEAIGYTHYGAEVRKAYIEGKNGNDLVIAGIDAPADVGRGLMGNFDDDFNDTSEFFLNAGVDDTYPSYDKDKYTYSFDGVNIGARPANINPSFLIWWDGDLSRELLNRTGISKYNIKTGTRTSLVSFQNVLYISKDAPGLSADLLGDWREEVCYPTEDNSTLRIFMTTYPTQYKIPTLMHDTQYRTAVAWQNVGYNQPPHPKFYVGKAALDSNGKYLAPATCFDTVKMVGPEPVLPEQSDTDEPAAFYTVNIKAAGDIEKNLKTYKDIEEKTSLSYAFPKYIVEDGVAYEAAQNSGTLYGGSIANVVKDTDIEIQYTRKYGGVVYLDDLDADTGKSADVRASNCLAQDNKPYTSEYKLKPGFKYKIVLRYDNTGRGTQFVADGNVIHTITESNNAWVDYTISDVTVEHESALSTLPGGNNTYDPLDTVLIINEMDNAYTVTDIDLTALENTGITITGASEITSSAVTLPGVQKDSGDKKPTGYITFAAPEDGTLSLSFQGSAVNSKNKPRLYCSTGQATMAKNSIGTPLAETTGANTPVNVELPVKKGTTYYLFGYLYNMTSEFTYTMSDFKFTSAKPNTYPITFANDDGTVIQTRNVAYGAMPSYVGDKPVKAPDTSYTYEFIGWDKEFVEATEAATYTAQYRATVRIYDTEPLEGFKNKLTIKKVRDGGSYKLTITPKEGKSLFDLTLYTAVYNEDNTLKSVIPAEYKASGNTITVTVSEPQLADTESYKIMLWDTDYAPVIPAITKETAEFFN